MVVSFFFFSFFISTLVGVMAVGEEKKVLSDFLVGASAIALLVFAIVYPPIAISSEIETRRIYLILSKGILRYEWFMAKLLSFFFISAILILAINLVNLILFFGLKGYSFDLVYIKYLGVVFLKSCLIIAISMSLSLITTSQYSTMFISTMIWLGSHFAKELKQSLVYVKSLTHYLLYTVYLLPDFSDAELSWRFLSHCIVYSLAWVFLGLFSFKNKEL